jgi:uncharacterized protein YbjT (DUF2867 family)
MRILILGATGFIGSAVAARLVAEGHDIITVSRSQKDPRQGATRHAGLDMALSTDPKAWLPLLAGIEAVINCAGILQDAPGESARGVHETGPHALFAACERAGVRRVIHFSAVGVDRETPTDFSRTKLQGDAALMQTKLDWVILRPSVVVGRAAYGGSALLRGLAALPLFPVMRATGNLQLVHLDDVVETVVFFLRPDAPTRQTLELVGPRRWSFPEAVQLFRNWMHWSPVRTVALPEWLAALAYRLGDAAALLGWRPPVRSTARLEIRRGAVGDPAPWQSVTGIKPRDIGQALASEPASVQERWFAQLYLLKALVFAVFGAFWLATGVISLGPGWDYGMGLLREGGLEERFAAVTIIAGALADIAIGCAILYRPTSRYGLYAALAISLTYALIGTILVPRLWADPLGPMLKIWPVIVLNLVALAILEDR